MEPPVLTVPLLGVIGKRPLPPVPWASGDACLEARLWGDTVANLAGLYGFLDGIMAGDRLRNGIGRILEDAVLGAGSYSMTPTAAQGIRSRGVAWGREIDGELGAEWSLWFWSARSSWALCALLGLRPDVDASTVTRGPVHFAFRVHRKIRSGMALVMPESKYAELLAMATFDPELNDELAQLLLALEKGK